MGELKAWARKKSKYLYIEPGETINAIYKGHSFGVDKNGETIFYKLLVENDIQEKLWSNKSNSVIEIMDAVPIGTLVSISRSIKDAKGWTKYKVEKVLDQ